MGFRLLRVCALFAHIALNGLISLLTKVRVCIKLLKILKPPFFTLVNKENKPFKAVCTSSNNAIFCYPCFGPTFGRDIRIMSSSNSNRKSFSDFGVHYKHTDYQYGTDKAELILAGSLTFQTLEIEVFVATN